MKFNPLRRSAAEMPFLDHLEELRWRILWSLLALLIATIGAFVFVMEVDVIGWLKRPIDPYLPPGQKLIFLEVGGAFFITLKLALTLGIIIAFPVVVYQAWAFLSPALTKRERRAIIPALYLGLVLFMVGAALAYWGALPLTLQFMLVTFESESLEQSITAGFYFSFVTKMLLAFGVVFELPVVVLVLSALGLVTASWLRSKRRYAVAGMAVLSAVITPGDAISLTIFLMVPLLLLYELSIGLAALVERARRRHAAADADAEGEAVGAT